MYSWLEIYLLTVEYLDFGMYLSSLLSLSTSGLSSTDCSMISHLRSWSETWPLANGVEADKADMIGVKGKNISYK